MYCMRIRNGTGRREDNAMWNVCLLECSIESFLFFCDTLLPGKLSPFEDTVVLLI